MTAYEVNWEELRARANARRLAKGMSWRQMAEAISLKQSAMHKVANAKPVSANALVTVLTHLDLTVGNVTRKATPSDN